MLSTKAILTFVQPISLYQEQPLLSTFILYQSNLCQIDKIPFVVPGRNRRNDKELC